MSDFERTRCLVTGASSGLGRAFATALVRRGAHVLGTGRDVERLEAWRREAIDLYGATPGNVDTYPADLTDPASRDGLVAHARERFDDALDLVVHSAGVGAYGRFLSHDPSVLRRIVDINFFALAELSRSLHPLLKSGTQPGMIVLGSIVARRGLPGRSEYSASKFAVAGWVEALRAEWSHDGIHILLVNPGFTRTPFDAHLLVDTAYLKVTHQRTLEPEAVAEAALRAFRRRRNELTIASAGARVLLVVNRLTPRWVDRGLARWTRRLYAKHGVE